MGSFLFYSTNVTLLLSLPSHFLNLDREGRCIVVSKISRLLLLVVVVVLDPEFILILFLWKATMDTSTYHQGIWLLLIFTSIGEAFVSGIKENEKAERR